MRIKAKLNAAEALVLTMVLVAVADGGMTDREIGIMAGLVQTLPVFHDFTSDQLTAVSDETVRLLEEDDGLAHAGTLMRRALSPKLRETAYALACEVMAGATHRTGRAQGLDMLDFVKAELGLDPLIAAAIERGVRARYHVADPGH